MTGAHTSGGDTVGLLDRADRLDAALARGGARLGDDVQQACAAALASLRERLALGVDHTVVALAGGTGSGKSSLFNAVSRLQFADVGTRRPTTSQVTACVWGPPAEGLLDWLAVEPDRRIGRESALEQEEVELDGLILLDLPDHDSIEAAHHAVVERMLPMADVLVFVVDPQKYADDALHTRYLRRLVGHEAAMLVLLNQVDTVPPGSVDSLTQDVGRLLSADGLQGVRVLPVSARTGAGVDDVRRTLAEAAGTRTMAATRVAAELDDVAALIAGRVGVEEPADLDAAVDEATTALSQAAGVPALVEGVEQASRGTGQAPQARAPQADGVELARRQWIDRVGRDLLPRWGDAVEAAVADAAELGAATANALEQVPIRAARSRSAAWLRVIAAGLGVLALALAAVAVMEWVGVRPELLDVEDGLAQWWAAGVGAAAIVLALAARQARRSSARRRSAAVQVQAHDAVRSVVQELLAGPTLQVLADHAAVREVVAGR